MPTAAAFSSSASRSPTEPATSRSADRSSSNRFRDSGRSKPVPSRSVDSAGRDRRILDVLMALQPGEVVTYGDIAEVAGYPRLSRLVGHILATTETDVPWWRVVNSAGRLVAGPERKQAGLLREGDGGGRKGHGKAAPHRRFNGH